MNQTILLLNQLPFSQAIKLLAIEFTKVICAAVDYSKTLIAQLIMQKLELAIIQ